MKIKEILNIVISIIVLISATFFTVSNLFFSYISDIYTVIILAGILIIFILWQKIYDRIN